MIWAILAGPIVAEFTGGRTDVPFAPTCRITMNYDDHQEINFDILSGGFVLDSCLSSFGADLYLERIEDAALVRMMVGVEDGCECLPA